MAQIVAKLTPDIDFLEAMQLAQNHLLDKMRVLVNERG